MIELTLTEEQAKIVSKACEFYARIRMGQFGEIAWHCAEKHYTECPEEAQLAWLALRHFIYPDLQGPGHSYGIGKFEDADMAYDVHQVIRHTMGFGPVPFSYHELPKCQRLDDHG